MFHIHGGERVVLARGSWAVVDASQGFVLMVIFYGFYYSKSPLNHHLEYFSFFPSILCKSKWIIRKRPANHSLFGRLDFQGINRFEGFLNYCWWFRNPAPPVTYEKCDILPFGAGIFLSTVSTVWPEVFFETKFSRVPILGMLENACSRVLTKKTCPNCNQFETGTYFGVTLFCGGYQAVSWNNCTK